MQPPPTENPFSTADQELLEKFQQRKKLLLENIHKVICGQEQVIEDLLTVLFARGHALLIGVPGLAKTLLIKTLAACLGWEFKRIQFTPDLMPSDITGTEILETDKTTGERQLRFVKGPLFTNLLLADEINRTPPKTQAALLESMQEYTVTAAGCTYHLEKPFFVAATQNPIEQEGTYPLPEAQLDRFMFSIEIDYPSRDEEITIVEENTTHDPRQLQPVFGKQEVLEFQELVRRIPVSRHVTEYAIDLARATRVGDSASPKAVRDFVEWGAGPRASMYLILGAKSRALLQGKPSPSCADVRAVAQAALRHRVIMNYNATGEGVRSSDVIKMLLESVPEKDYSGKVVRGIAGDGRKTPPALSASVKKFFGS